MARRWVRFEMPVMVCVEVDEHVEDARVVTVVVGAEDEDITLDRDGQREVLVYDESMERVAASEPIAAEAISVAEDRAWPEQRDWEFGPDAFRDSWLYAADEDNPDAEDRLDVDEAELARDDDGRPGTGAHRW